jgi:mannose-6-phosphate isomerase-like protein (cupin superfamily)
MKSGLLAALVILLVSADATAQARGRGANPSSSKVTQVRVGIHGEDGAGLNDVRIVLSGDSSGEFTTGGAGTAILPGLKDGTYRLRVERTGFITIEREFSLRGGAPAVVDITLMAAPPSPPPSPPPAPAPTPAKVVPSSGSPVNVSIIDFLDRNFIGNREPTKESILACTPLETVRLLQLREPVASHSHADADEVLYVVAGEGTARLGDQALPLKAGTMVVVPHAMAHTLERQGKNPLMLLSTLAGAACRESVESR